MKFAFPSGVIWFLMRCYSKLCSSFGDQALSMALLYRRIEGGFPREARLARQARHAFLRYCYCSFDKSREHAFKPTQLLSNLHPRLSNAVILKIGTATI